MTLPAAGPISMNDLAAEYGVPNTTPLASYLGKPGAPTSGPVSLEAFYGASNVTFTPVAGEYSASGQTTASYTLSCSQAATWTYAGGGDRGSANVASGNSATSITFTLTNPAPGGSDLMWSVTGEAAGVSADFSIELTVAGKV